MRFWWLLRPALAACVSSSSLGCSDPKSSTVTGQEELCLTAHGRAKSYLGEQGTYGEASFYRCRDRTYVDLGPDDEVLIGGTRATFSTPDLVPTYRVDFRGFVADVSVELRRGGKTLRQSIRVPGIPTTTLPTPGSKVQAGSALEVRWSGENRGEEFSAHLGGCLNNSGAGPDSGRYTFAQTTLDPEKVAPCDSFVKVTTSTTSTRSSGDFFGVQIAVSSTSDILELQVEP